tara:strand:- start:3434 stop:5071 length:1638 start_codon:yes stop_codon:yes gene_type:complete
MISVAVAGIFTILALAGPAWERDPQPVFREQSALVLILDLSRSMNSTDIMPTRLVRARHKVLDILRHRNEGYTALIVYAGEPFVVTPLTEDVGTIAALVPALSTDIMPVHGSRPDLALDEAVTLITQAQMARGHVLLLTDGIAGSRIDDAVIRLRDQGHRLSVLGIGTEAGAPISLRNGEFLKDGQGSIVIPKMNEQQLRKLAKNGEGRYSLFRSDDRDIEHLMAGVTVHQRGSQTKDTGLHIDRWREEGPWLLLVVLPIAAMTFRRGHLAVLVFVFLVFPARAYPFDWDALWLNSNQRATSALKQGNFERAAKLFSDQQWKATAQYRAEQFEQAALSLKDIETPDALYNKGNALARGGRFPDALEAYNTALNVDNTHEDARYNRDLIEQFLEQQQRQQDRRGEESDDQQAGRNADSDEQQLSREKLDQHGGERQQDLSSDGVDEAERANEGNDQHEQENVKQQHDQEETRDDQKEGQQVQSDLEESSTDLSHQTLVDVREDLESQQADEQWLRRIPDDPGGLLRRKFLHQYNRRSQPAIENTPW